MRKIIVSTIALGFGLGFCGAAEAQLVSSFVASPVYTTGTLIVSAGKIAAAVTPPAHQQITPVVNSVSPVLVPVTNSTFMTLGNVIHTERTVGKAVQNAGLPVR